MEVFILLKDKEIETIYDSYSKAINGLNTIPNRYANKDRFSITKHIDECITIRDKEIDTRIRYSVIRRDVE